MKKEEVEKLVKDRFSNFPFPNEHVYFYQAKGNSPLYPSAWYLTSCADDIGGNELGNTEEEIKESLLGIEN